MLDNSIIESLAETLRELGCKVHVYSSIISISSNGVDFVGHIDHGYFVVIGTNYQKATFCLSDSDFPECFFAKLETFRGLK